jgi:hypothetical protein
MLLPPLLDQKTRSPRCNWDSGTYCLALRYYAVELRGRYLPAVSKAARVNPEQS